MISSLVELQTKSQAARNGKVNGEAAKEGEALAASLKEWLVGRVLEEDRHTARILSEKGVS
jgi:hemerythrin